MDNAYGEGGHGDKPVTVESVGALVAFLGTTGLMRRRQDALRRLRSLRASEQFAELPEDLQQRVGEILSESQPR